MAPSLNSLLVLLSCVVLGLAHNMQLRAHSRECFHEMLHADDRMTVTFQVGDREFGGSGNLDVDFWVGWPFRMLKRRNKNIGIGNIEEEGKHLLRRGRAAQIEGLGDLQSGHTSFKKNAC
jgi:hypothetical protein